MYKIITFLFVLMAFTVNLSAKPATNADLIKSNVIAMWAAVEKGDVEEYLKYVHDDYTVFGESDTYLQSGKDKERASYADYLMRAKNVRTFMHQPEFHIRGNTAWMTYYWTDSGTINGERFTSRGKSTRIFVKENGQWLCIHGHFTAVE
ncbi:MAG: nuclear transport factor 2 family protein [Gammaproteobacteria bacterium]|nr:nuclear transport factor 2 family protein [Gammaproteobacteria bacterium]NNC97469.1 nuclear transport factor 2 family protein [Gammaproteobacteria bacterium]NNM14883.1 nuclear transport factor 2 family protein [Gammaproteobacteria bacterium]